MAVSRVLRVDTLLPRSVSKWMRNAATSVASMSPTSSREGGFAGAIVGEDQQQPQRVAKGGDGAGQHRAEPPAAG
jgi:hypothetical protein